MMVPKPAPALRVDEFRDFIRRLPCVLATEIPCVCAGYFDPVRRVIVSEFCHARTRRNNGDVENGLPMCAKHHKEQHRVGIKTFAAKHRDGLQGRTLREAAVDYWADFLTQTRVTSGSVTPQTPTRGPHEQERTP